jgi:conjugal transfer pilus assembly protein TraB
MPLFLHALLTWLRRRPAVALLGSGLLGWLLYAQMTPPPPVARPVVAKAQAVPGLGTERAVMEKTLLDVQKDNATLKGALQDQERTLHQIQQAQQAAERERQATAQAQEQRVEEILKRAQQAHRVPQPPASRPTPKPQPPPAPVVARRPTPALGKTAPGGEQGVKVRILRSDKAASFAGPPPSVTRGDTPYLPAGSYAEGRLVTGVFATSRIGGALPVLFAVTSTFHGPFQLGGPGLHPLATALPIAGCLILGKAQADLASSRVLVQLDTLSCVFPDGATFERSLKGYATGVDGTLGLVGRLETRDAAYLARTFLTSLMAGASEAFALAKRTTIITPLGGTLITQTGQVGETAGFAALAQAAAQLSQFYLQQAERLMPVLWTASGSPAHLVLQEGLALDGLPTTTTLSSRGLP